MKSKRKIFKNMIIAIVILLFMTLTIVLGNSEIDLGYINITNSEAKLELDKDENIILIDVRRDEEYNQGRIPGSILIPVAELEEKVQNIIEDKTARIFVYCLFGTRSKEASEILVSLGYENVYNLEGIAVWEYDMELGEES